MRWALGTALIVLLSAAAAALWWPSPTIVEEARPDFVSFEQGAARKAEFIDYFLPMIREENNAIRGIRRRLGNLRGKAELSVEEREFVQDLATEYRLPAFAPEEEASWQELLSRVDVIPASMVLAQAASESGWGTSRFAREGANFFGIWCFREGCGLIPTNRDEGARHEVAVFSSPRDSLQRYIHNLNTHPAYKEMRRARAEQRASGTIPSGMRMVQTLARYSTRGHGYIEDLASIIRFNQLGRLDLPPVTLAQEESAR